MEEVSEGCFNKIKFKDLINVGNKNTLEPVEKPKNKPSELKNYNSMDSKQISSSRRHKSNSMRNEVFTFGMDKDRKLNQILNQDQSTWNFIEKAKVIAAKGQAGRNDDIPLSVNALLNDKDFFATLKNFCDNELHFMSFFEGLRTVEIESITHQIK